MTKLTYQDDSLEIRSARLEIDDEVSDCFNEYEGVSVSRFDNSHNIIESYLVVTTDADTADELAIKIAEEINKGTSIDDFDFSSYRIVYQYPQCTITQGKLKNGYKSILSSAFKEHKDSDNPARPSGIVPMISKALTAYAVESWFGPSTTPRSSNELYVVQYELFIEISGSQLSNETSEVIVWCSLSDEGQKLFDENYPHEELPYWIKEFDNESEAEQLANELYEFISRLDNSVFNVDDTPMDRLAKWLKKHTFATETP